MIDNRDNRLVYYDNNLSLSLYQDNRYFINGLLSIILYLQHNDFYEVFHENNDFKTITFNDKIIDGFLVMGCGSP